MRNELEWIQLIEKYLNNELNAEDKKAFEQKMNENADFKASVEKQRLLQEGIKNVGTKQAIQKAKKVYTFQKIMVKGIIITVIAAVATTAAVLGYNAYTNETPSDEKSTYESGINEEGEPFFVDADALIAPQLFSVKGEEGQVIQTKQGMVVAVPEGAFLDENGKPVTGNIQLVIKEALDPASIMSAGLSTKSGEELLETGGMFYINARQNGKNLTINPANPVVVQVPTDEVLANMNLYKGVRQKDGSLDWQNPKPIEQFLTPVDITKLNFYPPLYEPKLTELGYGDKTKQWKDSVYYSFGNTKRFIETSWATNSNVQNYADDERGSIPNRKLTPQECLILGYDLVKDKSKIDDGINTEEAIKLGFIVKDIIYYSSPAEVSEEMPYKVKEVNPAKVQAFWNAKFNNTLLATKEFEERMTFLHYLGQDRFLELYINNLDKRMATIDSMVLKAMGYNEGWVFHEDSIMYIECDYKCSPEFLAAKFIQFALQNKGRVNMELGAMKLLQEYYQKQYKIYGEAAAKAQQKIQEDYNKAVQNLTADQQAKYYEDNIRNSTNLAKEINDNLDETYKQLGIKRVTIPPANYTVPVTNTGWHNIDRIVIENTINRTDINVSLNGKTAQIKYEPMSVVVADVEQYDRLLVYLLPEQLFSFQRVMQKGTDKKFTEKLNEFYNYDLMVIGYKNDEVFYNETKSISPKEYSFSLKQTTKADLNNILNASKSSWVKNDLIKDIADQQSLLIQAKKVEKMKNQAKFREEVERSIFYCNSMIVTM